MLTEIFTLSGMLRSVIISYGCFGTACRYYLQGSSGPRTRQMLLMALIQTKNKFGYQKQAKCHSVSTDNDRPMPGPKTARTLKCSGIRFSLSRCQERFDSRQAFSKKMIFERPIYKPTNTCRETFNGNEFRHTASLLTCKT